MTKIIRVFPRRTTLTPTDDLAFVGDPPLLLKPEADEVHISVAFTWDIPQAEKLAETWKIVAPVALGGPAMMTRGDTFEPGRYIRHGCTITSRGCPNRCWFCAVPRRDGDVRELQIRDGWNVLDDNLLACSEQHIRAVFAMLSYQPKRVQFTGGLEAARLHSWHVDLLASLHPLPAVFFAYDTPDDEEPLRVAARMMFDAGFSTASHRLRCYVLIGYPRDTMELAEQRLRTVVGIGLTPMAMLWRNQRGDTNEDWRRFQRQWVRPALIHTAAQSNKRLQPTRFRAPLTVVMEQQSLFDSDSPSANSARG